MRFYVMNHSPSLSAEISAQISRFRLIRALFLVEVILLVAVMRLVRGNPSNLWSAALLMIAVIALANYYAVRSRFGRYCRAVERSYKVLMIEPKKAQAKADEQSLNVDPPQGQTEGEA
jgi:hypothetical protein